MGIRGSYYFRIVPKSFDRTLINEISLLGHEIGYHYEDVDLARKKVNITSEDVLIDAAYSSFCMNLEIMNNLCRIDTICAHGSPLSPYDNKIIWTKYNYKNLGLKGEPYLDTDWNEFIYFTDSGRRWNGSNVSVRDKINNPFDFKSTKEIIENLDKLPEKMMVTIHPQRWSSKLLPWSKELLMQNAKNIIKKYYYVRKNKVGTTNF